MLKQILSATKVVLLALVLSFGLSYALAWTAPTATPPGANVAAPINAGSSPQEKLGGLTAGSLTTTGLTTTGTLKVTTGAGAAKVLTSDASGNATWQAAAGGSDNLGNHTATQALDMAGNNISATGDSMATFGPNSTWGTSLNIGGNGHTGTNAYVTTTNGTLHIGAKTGVYATWLNYYGGTGGIYVGNGVGSYGLLTASDVYSTAANTSMSTIANRQIGVGQTWQNVTASRAFGTTYTNSTGKPIMVVVNVQLNAYVYAGPFNSYFYINGGLVETKNHSSSGTNVVTYFTYNYVIPDGTTYMVSGGNKVTWWELR